MAKIIATKIDVAALSRVRREEEDEPGPSTSPDGASRPLERKTRLAQIATDVRAIGHSRNGHGSANAIPSDDSGDS
jgi:hypothetical protein